MVTVEDVNMHEVIVRNAKSKFHFHHEDNGYVFYREDNRKGIRINEDTLTRLLNSERIPMQFGTTTKGIFYVDWSLRDERIAREEYRKQYESERARKREIQNVINESISDDDPDLIAYVDALQAKFGKHNSHDGYTKRLIYGIRNRDIDILTEILAQGRGQNEVSKAYFRQLTGALLPSTRRDIIPFLTEWCADAPIEQETAATNTEIEADIHNPIGGETRMTTLIFEGAGWNGADSSVQSGVGNCRIRTRLRNNDGRVIYLEMGGWIHSGNHKPKFAQPFHCVGHVDHCFYADSDWDAQRGVSAGLKLDGHFEYSPDTILEFVNTRLNCSFDAMEVVNDGSVRVFDTSDPLCESTTRPYTPYADPVFNISILDGITPLHEWHKFRMAKYRLDYAFVRSVPFIGQWIADRTERERDQFERYVYHINLRWNVDGRIMSAEISSDQNFATFGIGLDTLRDALCEIVAQEGVAAIV